MQAEQRGTGSLGIGRAAAWRRDELHGGAGGEHRFWDAVATEEHGERQAPLGETARRHLLGAIHRQGPGDRLGRGLGTDRLGYLLPPPQEQVAVVPAGDRRAADRRAGLGQGEWVAAEISRQVHPAQTLVGIGAQPGHEVGESLMGAERSHRENQRIPGPGYHRVLSGSDQHPAGRAARPQPVEVGCVSQPIQDHQPRLGCLRQPGQEPGGSRLGVIRAGRFGPPGGGPHIPGQHRVAAGGGQPDQQARLISLAPSLRQIHGKLRFPGAAGPVIHRPGWCGWLGKHQPLTRRVRV